MEIYFQSINTTKNINFCSKPDLHNIKGKIGMIFPDIPNDSFQRCIPHFDLIKQPIKSKEEFNIIFNRIVNEISNNGEYTWYSEKDHEHYRNIANTERGLVPYCGDKSKYINMFLSGRLTEEAKQKYKPFLPMNEDSFIDVIRALEYSLNYLDKQYGKYNGIVFRQGFMSERPNQYISTSTDSIIANCFSDNYINFSPDKEYSVIRTYNGHKINEFQAKMQSEFANREQEILLPYQSHFIKLNPDNLDIELSKAKETMASGLFKGAKEVISGEIHEKNGYTKQDLLNMINVYEEVI